MALSVFRVYQYMYLLLLLFLLLLFLVEIYLKWVTKRITKDFVNELILGGEYYVQ